MISDEQQTSLRGTSVAITGRMASMARSAAIEHITCQGGTYVTSPAADTTWLVVGQGGPPLGQDGRLTDSLRRAHELHAAGSALRIVEEEELLGALGLAARQRDLQRLFTPAQLARMLDVPARTITAWVRHGLITPKKTIRRLSFFDFAQVANIRALIGLTATGISPARLRKSLAQLGSWYAEKRHCLAQIESLEGDGSVLVRLDDGQLAESSGQLRLGFEPEPAAATATDLAPVPARLRPALDEFFERGVEAEERGEFEAAVDSYTRALDHEAPEPEVYFNLGNAYYALGKKVEAVGCFTRSTELEPDYVEAWNNLGNALAELDRHDEAVRAYERALVQAPEYADPLYNLAETYANQENFEEARKFWLQYLERDPSSDWARDVRERLKRLQHLEWLTSRQ